MATLIVTPFTPDATSGRGLRTVGIVRALARSDDVEVAYVEFDGSRIASALESAPRVTLRRLVASRGVRRATTYAVARLRGTPRAFARGVSPELVRAGRSAAGFERVVADGPTAAAALLLVRRGQDVVYNAHNLESEFRLELTGARRDYGGGDRLRAFEQRIIASAREVWLPTHKDLREAAGLAPEASLRYVPNVVDVSSISPVTPAGAGRILFVGDFTYEPNQQAARFLVNDVMPELWRSAPEARLALVGRGLDLPAERDDRIEAPGFVEDLRGQYAASDCAVVPLLAGGGSPLKLVEAMAYGLPVVATPHAAAGLDEAEAGVHYEAGEGSGGLAEALARVLGGRGLELAARGRELAERAYSIEALAELLATPAGAAQ